ISEADPDCSSVSGYSVPYDGDEHTASGDCLGVDGVTPLSGLDLTGTAHTDAVASHSDPWTFTDSTGNYNDDSSSVTDEISKVDPNCTVTGYSVNHDGNSHTASGSCTGVNGETLIGLDLTGTTHTDVGNYTDSWTFTDSTGNYNDTGGQ